jgi:signal peptidase I
VSRGIGFQMEPFWGHRLSPALSDAKTGTLEDRHIISHQKCNAVKGVEGMLRMPFKTVKVCHCICVFLLTATITLGTPLLCAWSETQKLTAYKTPGQSMEPTLMAGQNIVVREFGSENKMVKTGDIVVVPWPEDRSKLFIMRVIGIGGEKLEIKDKKVFINDRLLDEPYVEHKETTVMPAGSSNRDNMSTIKIPEDSVFVMGDNRDRSFDSRFWGYVKTKDVVGLLVSPEAQKK